MMLVISGSRTFVIIYHFLEGSFSTIDVFGRVGYRVDADFGFQTWEQNIRGRARWMHSTAGSVYVPERTWMGVDGVWLQWQLVDGRGSGVASMSMSGREQFGCG